MNDPYPTKLEELVRASSLLTRDPDFKTVGAVLVEQSRDITRSDLACLYLHADPERSKSDLRLIYRRGDYPVPESLPARSELISFIEECGEAVLLLERKESPFRELLLNPAMDCGIALPLATRNTRLGVLILNHSTPLYYDRQRFLFLDSFAKLAGGALQNARLYQNMKDYLKRIQELERYQENIFSSMTNLLIATDARGRIRYYNRAARETFAFHDHHLGQDLKQSLEESIDGKILKVIDNSRVTSRELLGVQGIHRGEKREMDFSLNISPLTGKRGRPEGITLLFTDQSRERELRGQMKQVVAEGRMVKDMFSRYLSREIVSKLVDAPELVKPGGDKKEATIFFADIRGYTSFSEGKDPEYIIQILNEYFSEAVESVINHKGYIDKFIGDCIMACWGVPLQSEEEDAVQAVSCALEIQEMVRSKQRKFFRGEAASLRIGIGMHTGPIVAGNLGSSRRMNYTVIGDTVNVAARLEGVAGAEEVIITQHTRDYLGNRFRIEKKPPVKVKGKSEPIPIYNVRRRVS